MAPTQQNPSAYQLLGPNPFRTSARLWGQKPQPFHYLLKVERLFIHTSYSHHHQSRYVHLTGIY